MLVMVPTSLLLGVLAGMREGSRLDRVLSTVAIASTATPEYVSGVIFVALLASPATGLSPLLADWGWINGKTLLTAPANVFTVEREQALHANEHMLWMQGRFVGV